jgi:phage shock protein C
MTNFCPKCGSANEEFAIFCASCGESIEKVEKKGVPEEAPPASEEQSYDSTPPPTEEKEKTKLYRSRTNKMISGLSAGLAKEFNMEVDLVRILWVIFFIVTGGTAILVYIILWIVIPLEPENEITTTEATAPEK